MISLACFNYQEKTFILFPDKALKTTESRRPDELRGSRTVLRGAGGEILPAYATPVIRLHYDCSY